MTDSVVNVIELILAYKKKKKRVKHEMKMPVLMK